jgi:hypothetical protein
MKKKIQVLINIFFFTFLFLILINIFISISWKFYNNFKFSNNNPFPKIVRSNFKLNDKEQTTLFKNTHQMKYYFQGFVGPLPTDFKSEYVNYNKAEGRKTFNNKINCEKKIVFFGGSTTFGWLSVDDKTIPSFFSKNLNNNDTNYCIFNYGSPWFYSQQENNLLINLVDRKIIKPDIAIFIDGVNERCNGFTYEKNLRKQFNEIMVDHRTEIINKKISPLIRSLPIYQLFDRMVNKRSAQFEILPDNINCNKKELTKLFQTRLELRLKICENYNVQCVSFLQPFGGLHGNSYPIKKKLKEDHRNMYDAFKKLPEDLIINIADSLDNDESEFSYVDFLHYSHSSNDLISKKILSILTKLNKI